MAPHLLRQRNPTDWELRCAELARQQLELAAAAEAAQWDEKAKEVKVVKATKEEVKFEEIRGLAMLVLGDVWRFVG